jgi:hypothetical protein
MPIEIKQKLKDQMLEAIFIKTGGRQENPIIAEICAEVAVNFIASVTKMLEDNDAPLTKNCPYYNSDECSCIGEFCQYGKKLL